ncbi:DUF5825 family protein [Asanoa sp. WMMD1127]|uniref:DUF5825 family protein n=1 Tax=Asanoa sp. WMMD1127 TaxID=3016107 RepID=UPI002417037D|nr:DUF5825 family protein [Asanoa sp. WMMD1127]MDG4824884.1 DUF5825 family protein [Asanoa sp. WMMD1127]
MTTHPHPHVVAEPIVLAADPATLTFLAWLRDQHSATTAVAWRATVDPALDTAPLHHLQPPEPVGPLPAEVARWRASHRPALRYYRRGPGFIQVKDVRRPSAGARFVLDHPPLIEAFDRCLAPTRLSDLAEPHRRAAEALVDEQLLMLVDGWALTLPYRMRRWPVPSQVA